jgi:hypothetical protein
VDLVILLFFCLLAAPSCFIINNKIERKKNLGWQPWRGFSLGGLFYASFIRCFTTWGTATLAFDVRLAFSIFVIDPMYTTCFFGMCDLGDVSKKSI